MLSGCATSIGDALPQSVGGLPAGAPERPADGAYVYPAVHDMPPDRVARPLTAEEQKKVEADLLAARNRQRGR